MIKSVWICHTRCQRNKKASNIRIHTLEYIYQVEIERKCVMMLLFGKLHWLCIRWWFCHWMAGIWWSVCSSKLDFILTEIDRFHYECRFYSAHHHTTSIFTHCFGKIPEMHTVNGPCSMSCQLRMSIRNSNTMTVCDKMWNK